jgi:hypothetical protein
MAGKPARKWNMRVDAESSDESYSYSDDPLPEPGPRVPSLAREVIEQLVAKIGESSSSDSEQPQGERPAEYIAEPDQQSDTPAKHISSPHQERMSEMLDKLDSFSSSVPQLEDVPDQTDPEDKIEEPPKVLKSLKQKATEDVKAPPPLQQRKKPPGKGQFLHVVNDIYHFFSGRLFRTDDFAGYSLMRG